MSKSRVFLALVVLVATGCALSYSSAMREPLKMMARGDYERALKRLEEPSGQTNRLLYFFEKGLILHYQGEYAASNRVFEQAENLIEVLHTRSITREVAALLTNDTVRSYVGEEFERAFIHYYRALNYWNLALPQDALVECRRANLRLEDYAARSDVELTYRNDAFIQYISGLFYSAEGDWNDAYIALRDAEKGYRAYAKTFGMEIPRMLGVDLARMAYRLGYGDDLMIYEERYGLAPTDWELNRSGEVVLFIESGFIARKYQQEISMPIMEDDATGDLWMLSDRLVDRHYHYPHYHRAGKVKYWLRVALPEYRTVPSEVGRVRLRAGGETAVGILVEDLDTIAMRNLRDKHPKILVRAVARGLAKYLMTSKVKKENETFGFLLNLFGSSIEAADTRSWLTLPAKIRIARFEISPGTTDVEVEFINNKGGVLESRVFTHVEVQAGRPIFLNFRSYL